MVHVWQCVPLHGALQNLGFRLDMHTEIPGGIVQFTFLTMVLNHGFSSSSTHHASQLDEDRVLRGDLDAQRRMAHRRLMGSGMAADLPGAWADFQAAAAQVGEWLGRRRRRGGEHS